MLNGSIMERKLKLFISYSHADEKPYVEEFKKHIAPLKNNDLIEAWYDRKILPGSDYQTTIDNNLEDADIICLFISANFLSSDNCQNEKKKALELRKKKAVQILPVILSPCGWLDDEDISKLLALPTDGRPVSSLPDRNEAWHDVYNGLKRIIEEDLKTRRLEIKDAFRKFLQDAEILTQAHSKKETVLLDHIFVYPDLDVYSNLREFKGKISAEELLADILQYPKFVVAGENQSGRTTLCKMIFKELRKRNFVPVYVFDKEYKFSGKIENRISRLLKEQYKEIDIDEIDRERIVPIVDDFHLAKNKEKHIEDLSKYPHCILTVDDIFSLNISNEGLILPFIYFSINQFRPSLRYKLIRKWVSLTDRAEDANANEVYLDIDKFTELIDFTLGKIIGKGIMPAYPFFILSAIVTYETFTTPLDQEITSQGYCYQALVYLYLRKQGVKNEEIDIYINFLTELAYYFYNTKKGQLSVDDFDKFIDYYGNKFTLPIKKEVILKNIEQIMSADSFGNYSFHYPYLYYFFVAKYFAEHIEETDIWENVKKVVQNLHVNENAYTAIFLVHHTKRASLLDEIEFTASNLFDKYSPSTLTKAEVEFFDKQADIIVQAALPPASITPEKERTERLEVRDKLEEKQKHKKQEDIEDPLVRDLRKAVKTVEVIGCILKNRVGSLEKTRLERLFEEAMYVNLRILSSFFRLIRDENGETSVIAFISKSLKKIVAEKKGKLNEEDMEKFARMIFWNLNFGFVYVLINKIVHSLGSDKLLEIVDNVYKKVDTPASFLVKHGILMWYRKNLQVDEIVEKIERKDWSEIAKRVMKFMIANHCSLHQVSYRDRQKIESKLGIPIKRFLVKGQES